MGRTSHKPWFLGFGLYWTWVYLSFNSQQITSGTLGEIPFIPLLHIVSGLIGCLSFFVAIMLYRRIERSAHNWTLLWMMAACTSFGSMFYALPLMQTTLASFLAGAVISGFASVWIILGWGTAYCRLDIREATTMTAGSFLVAGALYFLITLIPQPLAGFIVTFLPILSVLMLYLSDPKLYDEPVDPARLHAEVPIASELRSLFKQAFSPKVILGIFMTMFVCGGLRIFSSQVQGTIYTMPLLVALPIMAVAALFLVYSLFVPHTSMNLGPLYRIAMPLFAIAIIGLAVFGTGNAQTSFFIISTGATLMDMLTWVLLIEIAHTTHYSPLLIFAIGRFVIHAGMALGECTALALVGSMTVFFTVSIVVLVIVAGYMFSDRDMTVFVEPPMPAELPSGLEPGEDLDARIRSIAADNGLSPRETDVFVLWATGHGAKSIQDKLSLSPATVKTHLRHIYEKCDVHSRGDILELIEKSR